MRVEVQVDGEDVDDVDGLVDKVAKLSNDEQERLSESIRPVKLTLVKVKFNSTYRLSTSNMALQICKIAYKIIHSTTILLPAWKDLLGSELKMSIRNIPHDMATRWNSTFDMLDFALEYQKPSNRWCLIQTMA